MDAVRVGVTADRTIAVVAGRAGAAFSWAHAFGSGAVIGLADAVITEHEVTAIGVGGARVVTPSVDAVLVCATIGVEDTGVGILGDTTESILTVVTVGAITIGGAFKVAESGEASFIDAALGVGDAELVDYLALPGDTGFTGTAIPAGLTGEVGGRGAFAFTVGRTDFPGSALGILITTESAASAVTGGSIGAVGVGLTD